MKALFRIPREDVSKMRSHLSRGEAERLVQTYSDLILRLSVTYLKNTEDAKDICQTVFLRLLEKPREFQSPEHERAWIIRTAVNVCKDQLKSSWRRTTVDLSAASGAGGGGGEPVGSGGAAPAKIPDGDLSLLLRRLLCQ